MGHNGQRFTMQRRSLLKSLGLSAVATAVPGLLAPAPAAQARTMAPTVGRIGVLVPGGRSGASFADGVQAGAGVSTELVPVEISDSLSSAWEGARDLLERRAVDLVVGLVSPMAAAHVAPLFAQHGKVLVVADSGADVVLPEDLSPYVQYCSLGYWQASWALGQWAARHLGRRGLVAASFMEAGYDALAAFELGFRDAGGAELTTRITHHPGDEDPWEGLLAAVGEARPEFVAAFYSGPAAREFLNVYARSGLSGEIPLAGSPFLVDEANLPDLGSGALGFTSCLSWAPTLPGEENQAFIRRFQALTGRSPDAFAVLGYDIARSVAAGQATGPRGRYALTADGDGSATPLYIRQVRMGEGGLRSEVIGAMQAVRSQDPRLAALMGGLKTGWLHTYLPG